MVPKYRDFSLNIDQKTKTIIDYFLLAHMDVDFMVGKQPHSEMDICGWRPLPNRSFSQLLCSSSLVTLGVGQSIGHEANGFAF